MSRPNTLPGFGPEERALLEQPTALYPAEIAIALGNAELSKRWAPAEEPATERAPSVRLFSDTLEIAPALLDAPGSSASSASELSPEFVAFGRATAQLTAAKFRAIKLHADWLDLRDRLRGVELRLTRASIRCLAADIAAERSIVELYERRLADLVAESDAANATVALATEHHRAVQERWLARWRGEQAAPIKSAPRRLAPRLARAAAGAR